jgi:protocatechuate 3,4-dioxygenase beta subunit
MKQTLRIAVMLLAIIVVSPTLIAQVSGTVFKDFNFNGTRQTSGFPTEPGVFGVQVKAFNAANVQVGATKTTDVNGAYSFTAAEIASGTAVRIEFTAIPGAFNSRAASGNGTNVQFVTAPSTTINYAIASQDWYSATANPYMATTGYTNGDAVGGGTAGTNNNLYVFPYDMGNGTPNDGGATRRLPNSQLGSVYGLAFQRTTRTLILAAYLKRHASFGTNGIGAIYRSVVAGTGEPATASLLVDVSTIGINVGTNPRTVALPAASNARNADPGVFAEVGKRGIGGIDLSDDGTELYFVNMFQKRLHRINIGSPIKASITAADATGDWLITDPSTAGTVWHPMGCKVANGKVYVGGVVVREKTTNHNLAADTVGARAIVYEFDPATAVFTEVLRFPLNYRRAFSNNDYRFPFKNNWWCAWQNNGNGGATDPLQADYNTAVGTFTGGIYYPQPMLSDIEFDVDGSMIVGIRDRFSDQMGYQNVSNDGLPTGTGFGAANNFFRGLTSGEVLRAGKNLTGSAFTIENRGQAITYGVTTGTLDAAAPGNPAVGGSWTGITGNPWGGNYGPGWGGTAGTIPAGGPNPGTQGGYFYFNQNFSTTGTPATLNNSAGGAIAAHYFKSNGGLALLAGSNEVSHTLMDPVSAAFTNGVSKMFNAGASAGTMSQRLQLVATATGSPGDPTNGGKTGGLGDLELLTDYQPIEVGNRVWTDTNGNGIQDPGEAPINGVAVQLVGPGPDGILGTGDDVVLANATTNAAGEYYFNTLTTADSRRPAGFTGVGANDILPGFPYQVRINPAQAALTGLQLTRADVAANATDNIDNDGSLINGFAAVNFNSAITNHNFDFGFRGLASLGDKVWRDDDKDGVQDANEPGVAGVTITLFRPGFGADGLAGTADDALPVATTVTDAYGNYLFDNLTPGSYTITVTPPANYQFTTQTNTVDNTAGTAPIATGSDVNATTGQSYTIVLSAGENERNVDAGLVFNSPAATASVGNRVWLDNGTGGGTANDGIQNGNEPGVSGVTVALWSTGPDGIAGNGDDLLVGTQLTDANGNYLFTNVPPTSGLQQYYVRFTPPVGMLFTSANQGAGAAGTGAAGESDTDSDAGANGITGIFTVTAGQQIVNVDAGIVAQPTTVASLGDRVWYDNNRDGDQDAGEPGVPGVTVNLYFDANNDGFINGAEAFTVVATRTTDGYGNYVFNNLTPGNYQVVFVAPSGLVITSRDATGGTSPADGTDSDADPVTGRTTIYNLPAGGKNMSIDCGLFSNQPAANVGALGDRVWNDLNGNGVQDAGEPGVGGITVVLFNSSGVPVDTTFTDATGGYLFPNLTPGNYSVGFSNLPAGFSFTGADQGGNDATDSDVNPGTGRTPSVAVTGGNTITTLDAGIRQGVPSGLGSIGNAVWNDLDGNGQQDPDETGVGGITVTLRDAGPDGILGNGDDGPTRTTITNALGQYIFTGLPAGNYVVDFSNLPTGFTVTTPNSGNDNTDSDGGAVGTGGAPAGTSRTGVINLATGEDNLTVDLGLVPPANTNTLGNFVWFDQDNDGVQDASEPGVPGVTVILYRPGFGPDGIAGNADDALPVRTTATDAGGQYLFTGLPNGTYSVGFTTLPAGFSLTTRDTDGTPGNGTTDSDADRISGITSTVTLNGANRNDRTLDAGLVSTRAALGNFVWNDLDGNGTQDSGEPGIGGVTVTLYFDANNDGSITGAELTNPVTSMVTDANGGYFFPNLVPGNYQVGFTTIPSGMNFTVQNTPGDNQNNTNSDATPSTGLTGIINLGAGEVDLSIDAGLTAPVPATIGDRVWSDLDKNGLQDPGEPGIGGVVVTLFNSSNQPIGSAVTDGNGNWSITNVPPGTGYYLVFTPNLPTFSTSATPGSAPAWTSQNIGTNGTQALNSGTESNADSDVTPSGANAGQTSTFSIVSGNNFPNMDAGIINWPFSAVLPVSLVSFTAAPQGNAVVLNWSVGQELNLLQYMVEFSANGRDWSNIGTVTAAGRNSYQLLHNTPVSGINYYRLKPTDRDGSFTYSEVRKVNFGKTGGISVYPNPAKDQVNITLTGNWISQSATISVVGMDGRVVVQQRVAALSQTETIATDRMASGKYVIRIQTNTDLVTQSFQVIR